MSDVIRTIVPVRFLHLITTTGENILVNILHIVSVEPYIDDSSAVKLFMSNSETAYFIKASMAGIHGALSGLSDQDDDVSSM